MVSETEIWNQHITSYNSNNDDLITKVKHWDHQSMVHDVWLLAVFPPPTWDENPFCPGAPALPRPERHQSFHQSSSELKAAHLRGKGAWDLDEQIKMGKLFPHGCTVRYFCNLFIFLKTDQLWSISVNHGSILEGQHVSGHLKRCQRFGWFMGRLMSARGGSCPSRARAKGPPWRVQSVLLRWDEVCRGVFQTHQNVASGYLT